MSPSWRRGVAREKAIFDEMRRRWTDREAAGELELPPRLAKRLSEKCDFTIRTEGNLFHCIAALVEEAEQAHMALRALSDYVAAAESCRVCGREVKVIWDVGGEWRAAGVEP